jgi:hypothetical protein
MARKTIATSTSTYQEQQEARKPYRDVIHQWKLELGIYEKNNRKRIEEASFKLWESGTVKTEDKRTICSIIIHDMREEVIAGKISEGLIRLYCPQQFKQQTRPHGIYHHRDNNFVISEQTLPNVLGRVTEVFSGKDLFRTERTPIENVVQESEGHLLSIPISWSGDDLIVTETHCAYLIPLLRRFKEILNDARKTRQTKAEMSSR